MQESKNRVFIKSILANMPEQWLRLTTHRLDIYNEQRAKVEFLECLAALEGTTGEQLKTALLNLPTAFDYIRLGHPLSCILEWLIAKDYSLNSEQVITFSSKTMPILAILRKNLLVGKRTRIAHKVSLPSYFDEQLIKSVYGYDFELVDVSGQSELSDFEGSTILVDEISSNLDIDSNSAVDFFIFTHNKFGSITVVNSGNAKSDNEYISEIQHVRRRESIAMTPHDSLYLLEGFSNGSFGQSLESSSELVVPSSLIKTINDITNTVSAPAIGSCGLSIQYAIMMGLINHSRITYPDKPIKFIVPPNCYGGTNDQARRVAACLDNVEIVDLPVDRGQDMVASVEKVLSEVANKDALAFIIAEIPTNPRVEVPHLENLRAALSKKRKTKAGQDAISPVFILDQTFCPNVKFLGKEDILSSVATISYVSGSKFPSGGICTAGYCVANEKAHDLMGYVQTHLKLNDNQATQFQLETLDEQMPSMNSRIKEAYLNTREFVTHIENVLPGAKINFVSKELAADGFTPSVFSLDLPTRGESEQEREEFKRVLNLKLINLMIKEIPNQSKFCVSYGQLKGCYWTIPATSTQGTTKEGDKDYIVRVSLSPDLDVQMHKQVFSSFCQLEQLTKDN